MSSRRGRARTVRPALATFAVPLVALAACSGETQDAPKAAERDEVAVARQAAVPSPTSAPGREDASRRGKRIKVVGSQFGRILADGQGQALYVFDAENSSRPECYGACAKAWPAVLTKGRPMAGKGVRGRLGTTRRRGGKRQVTINGRPLYYYVDDAPGRVLCHNVEEFGGLWLVVRGDGGAVP
jgi:predicted lipoprotein with Yx(FWY)xxD motif